MADLTAPDAAHHQHPFAKGLGAGGLEPLIQRGVLSVNTEGDRFASFLTGQLKQGLHKRTQAAEPEGMNGERGLLAAFAAVNKQPDAGDRLTSPWIHEHPTGTAVVEQIVDATIEQLTELGGTGRLFQMPVQSGRAALQGSQLQLASWAWTGS